MAVRKRDQVADNNDSATDAPEGAAPPAENTGTASDANVDTAEPAAAADRSDLTEDGAGVKSAGTDPSQNEDTGFHKIDKLAEGGTFAESARERDSSEDPSNVGDSVTNRTNDGVTYASQDGATGDNNTGEPSTKEGDAPVGEKTDRRPGGDVAAPSTIGDVQVQSMSAAATMLPPRSTARVAEKVVEMLKDFDGNRGDATVTETTNIHDEGLVPRANIVDFATQINETFGITVSVSECQNWLLVRDVVNTVIRKLAKDSY